MIYFIGIDLAWTYKNETGICVFDQNLKCIYMDSQVFSDEDIKKLLGYYDRAYVSIDAPLVVKNEKGGRACDSLLMKHKIHGKHLKLYATSRAYMDRVFGGVRGERLSGLSDHVYETYPTGIFLSLMPDLFDQKYKLSSRLPLDVLKKHFSQVVMALKKRGYVFDLSVDLVKTKKAYKHYEDILDAVLCAVNSHHIYRNRYYCFECDDNGSITLARE